MIKLNKIKLKLYIVKMVILILVTNGKILFLILKFQMLKINNF